ncbi:MAG: hypothetical protein HQK62_02370 [Desulfamplus sp.]|nr:hypothetical protein [Desulfamplus sp.]MBF0257675.1 hypothetical protein [Desulfamplus sp.]
MAYTINLLKSVIKPPRKKIDILPILLKYKKSILNLFTFKEKPRITLRVNLIPPTKRQPPKKGFATLFSQKYSANYQKYVKRQQQKPGFILWLFFTQVAETLESRGRKISELFSALRASESAISELTSDLSMQKSMVLALETELNTLEEDKKRITNVKEEITKLKEENYILRQQLFTIDNRIKCSIDAIQKKTPKITYDLDRFTFRLTDILWHIVIKNSGIRIDISSISRFFNLYYYYAMLKHQTFLLDSREEQIKRIGIILYTCLQNQGLRVPSCSRLVSLYCEKNNKPMPIFKGDASLEARKKIRKNLYQKYPILDNLSSVAVPPIDLFDLSSQKNAS